MNKVIVTYQYYYDLLFRAIYGYLAPNEYDLDYLHYIKAGIAFNTKGKVDSSRKISFYAQVYRMLLGIETLNEVLIKDSIKIFYEDIYELYLQCVTSHIFTRFDSSNLIFIKPTWNSCSQMLSFLQKDEIVLSSYKPNDFDNLLLNLPNIDVSDNQLKFIQAAYDCTQNNDRVLEVYYEL